MPKISLPNNWNPRPDQRPLWDYLERGGLRAIEIAHRRWGKDAVALHFTATAAMQRIGNYWHMLPMYAQARKAIWDAVNPKTGKRRIDEAFPKEIRKKERVSDMFIEFINGSSWQLVGSDNYDAYVGSPPIGITFSEWALANPMCWPYIMPILEENRGWALFITTSRGNNHAKKMLDLAKSSPGWFGEIVPASKTNVFRPEALENIRTELVNIFGEEHGEALYQQEYHCSFEGAIFGSYFAKQMALAETQGRVCSVPHQTGLEVYTFWDLGVDDSMTIWFMQQAGKSFHFIDYYENTGYGLEHYAKILKEKPYNYAEHYMPHDADAREMTNSEVALSRKEVAENLGVKPITVVSRVRNVDIKVQVQIPAVRNLLGQCWFDKEKCAKGISALEGYRAEYDEEKKVLSNRPLHDWCFTSDTHLLTKLGIHRIMDLPITGEVLTICGWKEYKNPRITRENAQLVEVVFNDGNTVRCTPDHLFLTENGWISANDLQSNTVIQSSLTQLHNILKVGFIGFIQAKDTMLEVAKGYILRLGNQLLEIYPKGATSITETRIRQTTAYQTLNASRFQNIYRTIGQMRTEENLKILQPKPGCWHPNGINLKKEDYGTVDKHNALKHGQNGNARKEIVSSVVKNLWHLFAKVVLPKSIALLIATPLAVVEVNKLNDTEDVWCLTVPGVDHFSLCNGAIVHNCSHGSDAFITFAVGYVDHPKSNPNLYKIRTRGGPNGWMANY